MIDVTAFIMGIAPPQRLNWLYDSINYLDKQNFPFKKKILSIDQFRGHTVPSYLVDYFSSKGWTVLLDSYGSRVKSMDRIFSEIDSEYLFYNEDDVLADLPSPDILDTVFNTKINDKECGMISMTLGGTQFDPESNFIGDLAKMLENKILIKNEFLVFKRMEEFKNSWFFEFPGLWINTKLFESCHIQAKKEHGQVEQALTKAYFNLGLNDLYYKSSICKSNALDILLHDPFKVNSHCRFLTNLDPQQGKSPFGGNHHY